MPRYCDFRKIGYSIRSQQNMLVFIMYVYIPVCGEIHKLLLPRESDNIPALKAKWWTMLHTLSFNVAVPVYHVLDGSDLALRNSLTRSEQESGTWNTVPRRHRRAAGWSTAPREPRAPGPPPPSTTDRDFLLIPQCQRGCSPLRLPCTGGRSHERRNSRSK